MKVTVTKTHIQIALNIVSRNSHYGIINPIAIALHSKYKVKWWCDEAVLHTHDNEFVCSLPPIATKLFFEWDNGIPVEPIEFEYFPYLYKEA